MDMFNYDTTVRALLHRAKGQIPEEILKKITSDNGFGHNRIFNNWHYGGIDRHDEDCIITRSGDLGIREEPGNGRFAWGLISFDIDLPERVDPYLDNVIQVKIGLLAESTLPWAVMRTRNGIHIHSLHTYWHPDAAITYPGNWRHDLMRDYQHLWNLGLCPDPKYVLASFLQCRCFVRLTPKPDATYAFKTIPGFIVGNTKLSPDQEALLSSLDPNEYYDDPEGPKEDLICLYALAQVRELLTLRG